MKIYIVEDDPEIRELESYAMKSSGYETMEFAEGSSFFEAIRREKPALVLLDVMLPGQDGLSILKAAAQSGRHHEPACDPCHRPFHGAGHRPGP